MDFETRSPVDLIRLGATRYAMDTATQALCLCWTFDQDEEIRLWHRNHPWIEKSPRPDELIERIRAGEIVEAHNAFFEYRIWNEVLTREFPEFDVKLDREQMRCSAAKGSCLSLPRALGDAIKAVHLPDLKSTDGKRLIDKLARPRTRNVRKIDEDMLALGCTKQEATYTERVIDWCEDEEDHRANWKYCEQDVRAERGYSNFLPEMTERELEYWKMDWRMNERGVMLDLPGAEHALELVRVETERLNLEMQQLTAGAVEGGSKRIQFLKWFNSEAAKIEGAPQLVNTQANTLSFALYGVPTKAGDTARASIKPSMDAKWDALGEAGAPLRRAMEICMEVNRPSNSKFKQMKASVAPDGRLHDIMLYNGADRTSRWSGKGVQPHNFVRGWTENMPLVWEDIMASGGDPGTGWGDCELINCVWGNPLPVLAKACRGALIASPGKELYAADFKAIEAVKLAWMAGCESQLTLFRDKGDPYLAMACAIYGRIITKADKDERQLGKKAVLGLGYCHAADTLILTRRGWVCIDLVEDWDMLWDGQEWVRHRGLVCNGEKYVTNLGDTFPTMDHPVWCGERFHRAEKVVADADLNRRVLEAGAEALPLQDMSSVPATASDVSWLDVTAKRRGIKSIWQIGAQVAQRAAMLARSARQRISDTPLTKQQCPTPTFEKCGSIGSLRQSAGATTLGTQNSKIMVQEVSKSASNGTKIEPHSCDIFRPFRDGIIQSLKWIERTMILAMSRATFAARPGVSNASTRAGRKEKVYDLIDAGPRHRYMILTKGGPMLVHNSMGWEKFQATVWIEEGIWLDDEMCQRVVKIYRKEVCPEMPALWKAVGNAAIAAVQNPGEEFNAGGDALGIGSISYFMSADRNFLHCRLPSGRLLAYLYPEVHTKVMWAFPATNEHGKPCVVRFPSNVGAPVYRARYYAEKVAEKQRKQLINAPPETFLAPHLSFMGRHIATRQWQRCGTHGGSLTENADQASSRDLLAEAMHRIDTTPPFELLLSIHDEVIAEAPIGTCSVKEFEALMSEVPAWAPGMPISAEGWVGKRLRK